nr:HRDC domain-containing protein [Chitinophagaceae bacterium]
HPRNIADTEVIAKLLNYEHTSLARLLENKFNIILDKKHQQSNWHIRPLRDDQLKYATDDVLYLSQLYAVLRDEAHQKGLTEWIGEEFNSLETVRYTLEVKTNFLKPGDHKNLSPWQQFILNEMFKLRDLVARKKNKPSYMIMPEQTVRDIAMGYIPYQDIQNVSGLHPSLKHGKTAKELIENIEAIFKESEKQNLDKRLNGKSYSEKEREEYRQKKDLQKQIKESIWSPVQQKMAQELGPFAARHILSNGWISKWLNGEVRWNDLQPNYKQKLILDIGKSEGIDFASITEYEKRYHH